MPASAVFDEPSTSSAMSRLCSSPRSFMAMAARMTDVEAPSATPVSMTHAGFNGRVNPEQEERRLLLDLEKAWVGPGQLFVSGGELTLDVAVLGLNPIPVAVVDTDTRPDCSRANGESEPSCWSSKSVGRPMSWRSRSVTPGAASVNTVASAALRPRYIARRRAVPSESANAFRTPAMAPILPRCEAQFRDITHRSGSSVRRHFPQLTNRGLGIASPGRRLLPNGPGTPVRYTRLASMAARALDRRGRRPVCGPKRGWPMSQFQINHNSAIYYQGYYWNELECVQSMIDRRIAGGRQDHWFRHFASTCGRSFERALVLNCGNGWVERQMIAVGLVREAVGIDFSDTLLNEARAEAEIARLPLRYHQMDVNTADFPDGPFDLVVNFAAAHHIAYIDRVFRSLCERLPDDGWFISFDYVGPHRNQYRSDAWEEAWRVNGELPEYVRQEMVYPHLPTMLHDDPTEAIHSGIDSGDPLPLLRRRAIHAGGWGRGVSPYDPQSTARRAREHVRTGEVGGGHLGCRSSLPGHPS